MGSSNEGKSNFGPSKPDINKASVETRACLERSVKRYQGINLYVPSIGDYEKSSPPTESVVFR